ncbi:deoxynucleotide monophosphate kinase protein [Rhizobium phage RHph_I46]|uniref:Deoxynucleotide monophosphate kinase protein n=1 Tax=Rhizobium phage RHph_I1_9 TaxID=2509729 RepID=A0A7S5R9G4_9CAUD|nr:deoxynucleoside monophosphate kinase [Rhizobium phage RHph_I1_9]QIG69704.1 deoxynucleotide monophosphate kinase protein [Rhizobium phage RHph_I46]QIG70985.1 deoxynucleotide monophosphate kinase protein [Rhizobium phage RHph_I9]QIG73571.1 deoxynucleotide monophosphate kinase protein [Rhizobium phage RHph_I1_9]QIG76324.1 deoxynucleotide monophosphate kinase protein [Rhizobium phage RHph_I34]
MNREALIVGLIGFKNSGKTSITKEYITCFNYKTKMIGFSNPLYEMLGVLGISIEEIQDKPRRDLPDERLGGKSIQFALNSLGTDWGRKMIYENIWTDIALNSAQNGIVNIADNVRFPNEFEGVKKRNGITVAIINPNVKDDGTAPEAYIESLQKKADYTIFNDPAEKTLLQAASELDTIININI